MHYFPKLIAVLFFLVPCAKPVSADAIISGPVCVIDGNTLQVGGKIKNGKCWGGLNVRLHGSIAPELGVTCTDTDRNVWDCGQRAKDTLARIIRPRSISCYHIGGAFEDSIPVVTCISGRIDLAMEMVKLGMAKSLHNQSRRYELEEKDAKRKKRGIWK